MEDQLETPIANIESRAAPRHNIAAVAKGGGVIFTGKLFMDALRFVTAFILARMLGAENYGVYSLALSAMNIGVGLSLLGLDSGLTRYVAVMLGRKDDESVWGTMQAGVSSAILMSAFTGTALFAFAYFVAENAFRKMAMAPLLQLVAVLIPVMTLSEVLASTLKGFKRMDYPVIAQFVFQPLIRLILIIILALTKFEVYLAIITFGVADLGASLLMVYYLNRVYPLRRPLNPARRDWKGLMNFSLPVWLSSLMVQFQGNIQALVLGGLGSITGVGLFSVASQITDISGRFSSSINISAKPVVAQLHDQGDIEQVEQLYQTSNKWAVMVQLPIVLLMIIYPVSLLSIFGKSYLQAAPALIVLAMTDLVQVGTGMGGVILDMTGHTKLKLLNSFLRLVLYLILDLLLIPRWGLMGAATAVMIGEVIVNLLRMVQVFLLFKILPFNRGFYKPVIAAAAGALSALLLGLWLPAGPNLLNAFLGGVLLVLVYTGVTFMLGFSKEELFILDGLKARAGMLAGKFKKAAP